MASYGWGTRHSVEKWLFDEGYHFDFYQAVRLLELIYPQKHAVGEHAEPGTEVVRFKSNVSLAFPPGEIAEITPAQNGSPAEMRVNFLGLAGALAPLPLPYTEMVLERIWKKDTAMRDFLDIFNHRIVSLMYRVRKLHRIALETVPSDRSSLAPFLYSFIGMQTAGLKRRMDFPDRSLLYYAGILAEKPRSMTGLLTILRDYFGVAIHARQMVGRWLYLDDDDRTSIGYSGRMQVLGQDASLGGRAWSQQGRFDLEIGPVPFERLLDFVPGGRAFGAFCAIVRFHAGGEHQFGLLLSVESSTVPPMRLGQGRGARLGWTSWLRRDGGDTSVRGARISPRQIQKEWNS